MLRATKTLFWILQLVLIVSCATNPEKEKFPAPTDYSEVIKQIEVQERSEIKSEKKAVLKQAKETIKKQSDYSNECFERLNDFESRLAKLEKDNENLKKENDQLKEELSTWRTIKIYFWVLIVIGILAIVWKYLSPIIVPLARRAIGIP